MKPIKFALTTLAVISLLILSQGTISCSGNELIRCSRTSQCPEGYRCKNRLCRLPCKKASECPGNGCIDGYCGGTAPPDGGTLDPEECTPGEKRPCYSGPEDTKDEGQCKQGEQACDKNGNWGKCEGEVLPAKSEDCNGKDDNCNGQIDENCSCSLGAKRPCYSGPKGTKGVGICKGGVQTCQKGTDGQPEWGQCDGEQLPLASDYCNNETDDDCDGKVNDGCECKPGQTRKCRAPNGCQGIQSCQPGKSGAVWGDCAAAKASDEVCDGIDNDCDGKTDNVKGKSDPLTRECSNLCEKGTETCKKGKWKDCSARLPEPEVCNNKDDDCDGKIDNVQFKDEPLSRGCKVEANKGLCKNGQSKCKAGKWGDCITPKPKKETCDTFDNDCDGKVDEAEDKPCGDGMKCIKNGLCVPA